MSPTFFQVLEAYVYGAGWCETNDAVLVKCQDVLCRLSDTKERGKEGYQEGSGRRRQCTKAKEKRRSFLEIFFFFLLNFDFLSFYKFFFFKTANVGKGQGRGARECCLEGKYR
jgi:hypothetical protein